MRRFGSPKNKMVPNACLFYATKSIRMPSRDRYQTALPRSWPPRGPRPTQARSCQIFFTPFPNFTRLSAYRSAADTDQQSTVCRAILLCITDLPLKMSRAATLVWSVVKVERMSPGAR